MDIAVLRHHAEDHLGLVREALEARGVHLRMIEVADGAESGSVDLPAPGSVDGAVVLGASASTRDRGTVPWMAREVAWLSEAIAWDLPVLGICFGAQALALAVGGTVERAPGWEIGWIRADPEPDVAPPAVEPGPWLAFHQDRAILPADTDTVDAPDAGSSAPVELLATSPLAVQAFGVGSSLGVQFHPEVDGAQLRAWLEHGSIDILRAEGIDPDELLARTTAEEPAARVRAARLVDAWLERRRTGPSRREEAQSGSRDGVDASVSPATNVVPTLRQ